MKILLEIVLMSIMMMSIFGCSGGSGQDNEFGIGYYGSPGIKGVHYKCANKEGITGSKGRFLYEFNKGCEFSLGDKQIERWDSSHFEGDVAYIFIQDENIELLFAALDMDEKLTTGIEINEENLEDFNLPHEVSWVDIAKKYIAKNDLNDLRRRLQKYQEKRLAEIFSGKRFYRPAIYRGYSTEDPYEFLFKGAKALNIVFDDTLKSMQHEYPGQDISWEVNGTVHNWVHNLELDGKYLVLLGDEGKSRGKLTILFENNEIMKIREIYDCACDEHNYMTFTRTWYKAKSAAEEKAQEWLEHRRITKEKIENSLKGRIVYTAEKYPDGFEVEKLSFSSDEIEVETIEGEDNDTRKSILAYRIEKEDGKIGLMIDDGEFESFWQVTYISDKKISILAYEYYKYGRWYYNVHKDFYYDSKEAKKELTTGTES